MLLDTDILIDVTRKHPPAFAWFAGLLEQPSIAGFAAMELTFGRPNARELREVRRFLAPLKVLWPDEDGMRRALDFADLHLKDGLGVLDALVDATVVAHNMPLATFNVKHYRSMSGLTTVQPYTR